MARTCLGLWPELWPMRSRNNCQACKARRRSRAKKAEASISAPGEGSVVELCKTGVLQSYVQALALALSQLCEHTDCVRYHACSLACIVLAHTSVSIPFAVLNRACLSGSCSAYDGPWNLRNKCDGQHLRDTEQEQRDGLHVDARSHEVAALCLGSLHSVLEICVNCAGEDFEPLCLGQCLTLVVHLHEEVCAKIEVSMSMQGLALHQQGHGGNWRTPQAIRMFTNNVSAAPATR
jgi:hypothetical protein